MTSFLDSLPEVPGQPGVVRHFAHRLGAAAEALEGHGGRLRSTVGSLVADRWHSPAADRFALLSSTIADDLRAAGHSYRAAAGVLSQYASALEQAQEARAAAQRQLDQAKVEAGAVDLALPMFSGLEDFNPAVRQAHARADEALHYVRQMAVGARAALETLAGLPVHAPGPAPRSDAGGQGWHDPYLGFGQDFGEGLYLGFKAQAMAGWNGSAGHLLMDPKGYWQFLQEQGDAGELAGKHPDEFGKSLIGWNDWTSGHQGRAGGELLATLVSVIALARAPSALAARGSESAALLQLGAADSWGRAGTLSDHFLQHGGDFGAATEDEYAAQASAFLQRSQMTGLPTKIDARGVIRVYDPSTGAFAAYNADGTTRTYFVPRRGRAYFDDQPGGAVQLIGQ